MYDEALTTYDEITRRMGADTLNGDYAAILRYRAIAAHARAVRGDMQSARDAFDFQTRYANLSKVLSDSLHKSEAHDYAARYHAQEQQLEIQEKEAEAERLHLISIAVAVIALLAIAFALFFFHQKRIVSEKNRVLVRIPMGHRSHSTSTPSDWKRRSDCYVTNPLRRLLPSLLRWGLPPLICVVNLSKNME